MSPRVQEIGNFASILTAEPEERTWMPAGFPAPDGSFWAFQEPEAVVIVQDGRLRVAAHPFTRGHDEIQFFDNAKHMYFSTTPLAAPEGGRLTLDWEMSSQIIGGRPGDLYDGFVSFHLLDLAQGVAVNIFAGNDVLATVYARLPFPGAAAPQPESGPRFFSLFEEHRGLLEPGRPQPYRIRYDRAAGELEWFVGEQRVKHEVRVPPIGPVVLAMGLMTEKDIQPGKGSVSCHGQGAVGTWGSITATFEGE